MSYKVEKLCVMLDCSRNAVMKVDKVKEFILTVKQFGYNAVMLYLEDTFEVTDEPLFGYMRGGYKKSELKELSAFAFDNGVELIPCIQTLAHLNTIFRHGEYGAINDVADVLLVGNSRKEKRIENIFKTVKECFISKTVNVGLDEAHLLGRGKYLDLNGYKDRFDIFCDHLETVVSIAEKNGLTPIMWSDTFFERSPFGTPYQNLTVPEKAARRVPKSAQLVCWDYYHTDKDFYDKVLAAHKQFNNKIWYACSAYTSRSFAPNNAYSMRAIEPAMKSCIENGINNIIVTMWGGNGAECSLFAVLPSLYFTAECLRGNFDKEKIAKNFKMITGEDFDSLCALDLVNDVGVTSQNYGPAKYMFFSDLFTALFDSTINPLDKVKYTEYKLKLEEFAKESKYFYLFNTQIKLCSVLEIKYDLGIRIYNAYGDKNFEELKLIDKDLTELLIRIDEFYNAFKAQWYLDNKPHGFDVQDIRIGGLIIRIESCKQRLMDFTDGKIQAIEELEEARLDILSGKKEFSKQITVLNDWAKTVTANIL